VDGRPTCPACGGEGRSRRYRVDDYDLHRCRRCRTEFLVLRAGGQPFESSYWDAYKFVAYSDDRSRAEYSKRYAEVLGEASKYTSTIHEVLDIGCGIGNFLQWADAEGFHSVGAELDPPAIEEVRNRGLEVVEVDRMADEVDPESVDLVTMWDVIEHLVDPASAVEEAFGFLRPGGLLILETPDVEFPLRPLAIGVRRFVEPIRYSDVLYFAGHRTYFSSIGLAELLEPRGFEMMATMKLRSPSAKMRSLFDHLSEGRSGLTMARLYEPLDRTMRTLGMTNKLVTIARRPWA
jgi:2-polyprenyl-3-methyl-5-hydroxy-6-metoxy-1,4-benzoquinol methylase